MINKRINIAIIGCRGAFTRKFVFDALDNIIGKRKVNFIIGDSRGAEEFAINYAKNKRIPYKKITCLARKSQFYYCLRNVEIITMADEAILFSTKGNRNMKLIIFYLKVRCKKTIIIGGYSHDNGKVRCFMNSRGINNCMQNM